MMKVFLRAEYNYDPDQASIDSGLKCDDESLAVQSQREDSDINTIVRRFGLTGELPNDLRMPQYGDFTDVPDYHEALNFVRRTEQEFLRVPADVRARFANDPQKFVDFFNDPSNQDEAIRLGLAVRSPNAPEPPVVKVGE